MSNQPTDQPNQTYCRICEETSQQWMDCPQCVNVWCARCDIQLEKCPYCRLVFRPALVRQNAHTVQYANVNN
jgi:hypothetical protein